MYNLISRQYSLSNFETPEKMKEAVMRDRRLSDLDKLNLVFDASKEDLKNKDPQLYYATLAVLRGKRPSRPFPYADLEEFFGVKKDEQFTCGGYFYRLVDFNKLQFKTIDGWRDCSQSEVVSVATRVNEIRICNDC